ncbi:MAG: copper homeostasis protein CutC [Bacteroidota bacterium]|nr:copper homeostasis protein CutC [Bacteroidota bacterium]
MNKDVELELCCSNIHSVELAKTHQFQGIELCSGLRNGGLTPSIALLKEARRIFQGELSVLIRPRPGNFVYNNIEKKIIYQDIKHSIEAGADTLVIGALTDAAEIDLNFLEQVVTISHGLKLCFHRAFDQCRDPLNALSILKKYKIDRLLTSGQKKTAFEGQELIKSLVQTIHKEIQIMAGGGIDPDGLINFIKHTGISRIHFSALSKSMHEEADTIYFGDAELANEEYIHQILNELKNTRFI